MFRFEYTCGRLYLSRTTYFHLFIWCISISFLGKLALAPATWTRFVAMKISTELARTVQYIGMFGICCMDFFQSCARDGIPPPKCLINKLFIRIGESSVRRWMVGFKLSWTHWFRFFFYLKSFRHDHCDALVVPLKIRNRVQKVSAYRARAAGKSVKSRNLAEGIQVDNGISMLTSACWSLWRGKTFEFKLAIYTCWWASNFPFSRKFSLTSQFSPQRVGHIDVRIEFDIFDISDAPWEHAVCLRHFPPYDERWDV